MIFNIMLAFLVKELVDVALFLIMNPWIAQIWSWIVFGVVMIILYLQGDASIEKERI